MKDASTCATTQKDDGRELVRAKMKEIKHKVIVMSGKGGVGKSTVSTNIATALANGGASVGLLDVDIHGPNIPKMLGIEGTRVAGDGQGMHPVEVPPGLKVMSMGFLLPDSDSPVIWRGPVKIGAIRQFLGEVHWGELDYLVVDLPPGTGDEPLTIAQLIPESDGAVIVTTPQDVALLDSRKTISFAKALNMPVLGIVENMSGFACPKCGEVTNIFKVGGGERTAGEKDINFLGRVPLDPLLVETGDTGSPIVLSHPGSPTAAAFEGVVEKLREIIKDKEA